MLSLRSRKFALTLFCTLALALALAVPAQAADHPRDHANLNRMIKKRAPDSLLDALNPVNNAGTGSTDDASAAGGSGSTAAASSVASTSNTAAASASVTTRPSSAAASTGTASSTTPASTASTTSTSASSTTSSSASTTSSTASSTTSSSTTSSSSSTSATPTSSAAPATSAAAAPTSAAAVAAQDQNQSAEAVTITSHVSVSASPTSSATAKAATSSSSLSKGAITTLAVIAGCIGGGALIWTIFRKWKLRTSKRFDDRLAPIDWQPPTDGDDVPGSNRRASIASSFHSAGHDGLVRAPSSSSSHGAYGAYGATSQHVPSLQPLPEHDFTAVPTTGAYLGANAGYADLARGPSPGPQMQDLSRGPSFNHGYNAYPQQQAPTGAYDYNNTHY